jgi:secondary thiamine-phosphate synthase enzyme
MVHRGIRNTALRWQHDEDSGMLAAGRYTPSTSQSLISVFPIPSNLPVFIHKPMHRKLLKVTTTREGDIVDLTPEIRAAVRESGITDGMVNVFVSGSTAAVTTIEYEPGVLSDLRRALSVLAPDNITYAHDGRWGDGNGRSHVKASLVGPSLSVPVSGKEPDLGTWQQVVLLELDIRQGRTRNVVVSVTG